MEVSERINTLDDILDYMKTVLGAIEWEREEIAKSNDSFEEKMDRLNDMIVGILILAEDSAKYFNKIWETYNAQEVRNTNFQEVR